MFKKKFQRKSTQKKYDGKALSRTFIDLVVKQTSTVKCKLTLSVNSIFLKYSPPHALLTLLDPTFSYFPVRINTINFKTSVLPDIAKW